MSCSADAAALVLHACARSGLRATAAFLLDAPCLTLREWPFPPGLGAAVNTTGPPAETDEDRMALVERAVCTTTNREGSKRFAEGSTMVVHWANAAPPPPPPKRRRLRRPARRSACRRPARRRPAALARAAGAKAARQARREGAAPAAARDDEQRQARVRLVDFLASLRHFSRRRPRAPRPPRLYDQPRRPVALLDDDLGRGAGPPRLCLSFAANQLRGVSAAPQRFNGAEHVAASILALNSFCSSWDGASCFSRV